MTEQSFHDQWEPFPLSTLCETYGVKYYEMIKTLFVWVSWALLESAESYSGWK